MEKINLKIAWYKTSDWNEIHPNIRIQNVEDLENLSCFQLHLYLHMRTRANSPLNKVVIFSHTQVWSIQNSTAKTEHFFHRSEHPTPHSPTSLCWLLLHYWIQHERCVLSPPQPSCPPLLSHHFSAVLFFLLHPELSPLMVHRVPPFSIFKSHLKRGLWPSGTDLNMTLNC